VIGGTACIRHEPHGWIAVFELFDAEPRSTGPYATRELAEERRDQLLEEVIEQTRAEGLAVEIIALGDTRVIHVLGPCL
jgi:hypothetical protein